MSFVNIFDKKVVDLNMKSMSKDGAIRHLSDLLKEAGYIADVEEFVADIYLREKDGITGIGEGVAIPHGKSDSVTKIGIAVGRCEDGIEWESLDGKPVRLIFLFAVSKDQYNMSHLKLLGELAGRLGRGRTIINLNKVCTYDELITALSDEEAGSIDDIEELNENIEIHME